MVRLQAPPPITLPSPSQRHSSRDTVLCELGTPWGPYHMGASVLGTQQENTQGRQVHMPTPHAVGAKATMAHV